MLTIKAHYDNNDTIITRFNGTVAEAVKHYIDRKHNFDYGEREEMATCRAVEFLEGAPIRKYEGGRFGRLLKVYSISNKMMERHDLANKIRQTWSNETVGGFPADCWKDDFAYIEA